MIKIIFIFILIFIPSTRASELDLIQRFIREKIYYPVKKEEISILYGGLSNKTFKVNLNKKKIIFRINMKNPEIFGINREKEFFFHGLASLMEISPKVIYCDNRKSFFLTQFIDGNTLKSSKIDNYEIKNIVKLIKTYHNLPNNINRDKIKSHVKIIKEYFNFLKKKNSFLPKDILKAISISENLDSFFNEEKIVMSHNDLFSKNIIKTYSGKLYIIDWEYGNWGNRFQDLASLSEEDNLSEKMKEKLIETYFGEVTNEIKLKFRIMCAIHRLKSALWALTKSEIEGNKFYDYYNDGLHHYCKFWEIIYNIVPDVIFHNKLNRS